MHYPQLKTKVAVKTVNDVSDPAQRMALLCEIKIMSNLDPHLNLVNMMGSCTSDFIARGELWLLLEFCEQGIIKFVFFKSTYFELIFLILKCVP